MNAQSYPSDAERNAAVLEEQEERMRKLLREGSGPTCPHCGFPTFLEGGSEATYACMNVRCAYMGEEYSRREIENAAELAGTRRLEEAANPDNAVSPEFERAELIDAGRRVR